MTLANHVGGFSSRAGCVACWFLMLGGGKTREAAEADAVAKVSRRMPT